MNPPEIISKELFTEICYRFVQEEMPYDEPIPEITEEGLNRVESCLKKPLDGTAEGKLFYKTIADQAAALFFCICKHHCFFNGNKRLAVITTLLFLIINGYLLKREKPIRGLLYIIACGTASTPRTQDKNVRGGLQEFFNCFIEEYNVGKLVARKLLK